VKGSNGFEEAMENNETRNKLNSNKNSQLKKHEIQANLTYLSNNVSVKGQEEFLNPNSIFKDELKLRKSKDSWIKEKKSFLKEEQENS